MNYFLGAIGLYLLVGIIIYLHGRMKPWQNRALAYNKQGSSYMSPIKMILLYPALHILDVLFRILDRFIRFDK